MPSEKDTVRINTRVHRSLNDWIDNHCKDTGMSKANLIYIALENYRTHQEGIEQMRKAQGLERLNQRIEELERKIGEGN